MTNPSHQQAINMESLKVALNNMLTAEIGNVTFVLKPLHGGTVGTVQLVTGRASVKDRTEVDFQLVWKTQRKWARHGDPDSWRREYDLYRSQVGSLFGDSFQWPTCYLAEMNEDEDEIQLWMAYIDGTTGLDLSGDHYERAAEELGRFQGKMYAEQPTALRTLTNLSHQDYMKNFYRHYRSWNRVYDYIRASECEIPQHLCQMMIDLDEQAEEIISRIERLPVVLCHRDYWVTNIIATSDMIFAIDWDTAGWGYLGEDLASLLADEADVANMVDYYRWCLPAYYRGFAAHAKIDPILDDCVYEMILFLFGYRLVEWYLDADEDEVRALHLQTLQQIYEIGQVATS